MKKKKKVDHLTPMMYRLQIIKEQSPEEYDKLMRLMKFKTKIKLLGN